jgi:DNA topoisomerase 2-associated protein PAT1
MYESPSIRLHRVSIDSLLHHIARSTAHSLEAIWDDKSPFSVLPRTNGASRTAASDLRGASPSAVKFSSYPGRESPAIAHHQSPHGLNQTGVRTLQEIEAEMLAAAQQSRSAAQRQQQQQALLLQEEENLRYQRQQQERQQQERHYMSQQQLLAQYEREQQHQVNSQRYLLQKEQERLQRTPPPRMLPGVSQSPRFHEHQRQILLLQQQQEQQQQQRLLELQDQLRFEEMERQMQTQLRLLQSHSPNNFGHRRQPSGPTVAELQAAHALQQHQQQRRQRSQSPAVGHSHFPVPLQESLSYIPQNIQLQQRIISEMAQAEFIRDMQGATSQAEQDALRAEAMRKIVEAEKMEERRRKKAAKIAHMVCVLFHCQLLSPF